MHKTMQRKSFLYVMLAIACMLACISLIVACNDDTSTREPSNPQEVFVDVLLPEYAMNVEAKDSSNTSFVFKPEHSGLYKLVFDNEKAAATIDSNDIESGNVQYYDKGTRYTIKYKFSSAEDGSLCGSLTPVEKTSNSIEVKKYNDYIVKYVPNSSALYCITAATDCEVKVVDGSYNEVQAVLPDHYFFKESSAEVYYIVIENKSYADVSAPLNVEKVTLEIFTIGNNAEMQAKQIDCLAGECAYFMLDIKDARKYEVHFYGVSGNQDFQIAIYDAQTFVSVSPIELIVGKDECIYKYGNLEVGQYYLMLEFKNDVSFELRVR